MKKKFTSLILLLTTIISINYFTCISNAEQYIPGQILWGNTPVSLYSFYSTVWSLGTPYYTEYPGTWHYPDTYNKDYIYKFRDSAENNLEISFDEYTMPKKIKVEGPSFMLATGITSRFSQEQVKTVEKNNSAELQYSNGNYLCYKYPYSLNNKKEIRVIYTFESNQLTKVEMWLDTK